MRTSLIGLATVALCALLIGGASSAVAAQAAPKRAPAAKPATPAATPAIPAAPAADAATPGVTWDELTQAIRNIESALKPDDAASAYAQGCNVNRSSVKLQDTYMKKQLKLGRPDLANAPAQELTKLDPKNGIAWGDICYVMAKRGPVAYLLALSNGLKGIDLDPENPGICQNVAQLVAWYEADKGKRPTLDPDVAEILKKLTSGGAYSKEYTKAAKTAKDGFSKLDQERQARKKEADEATAEAKKLETKYNQLNETLKAKGKAYDATVRRIETTQDQVNRASADASRATDYRQRDAQDRNQRTQQQQLRTARADADKLLVEGTEMRKQADDTKKEWETKRDHAIKLQRAVSSTDELPVSFGWVPPAVNGVITPDLMAAPPKAQVAAGGAAAVPAKTSYLAPDAVAATPAAPAGPSPTDRAAEAEAADMLDRARLGVDSKDDSMRTMAKNLLAQILKTYPSTKAATEAKTLAAKMQ
jgi:hypothetical protein